MSKPLPLPVWDRQRRKLVEEWMDENPATYESQPRRSLTQWVKSQPLYDWLVAAYQNTRGSARQIEPFIREHHIDRIHGELLMLGFEVAQSTVSKYMVRGGSPSQGWKTFFRNHTQAIAAIDLFVVP